MQIICTTKKNQLNLIVLTPCGVDIPFSFPVNPLCEALGITLAEHGKLSPELIKVKIERVVDKFMGFTLPGNKYKLSFNHFEFNKSINTINASTTTYLDEYDLMFMFNQTDLTLLIKEYLTFLEKKITPAVNHEHNFSEYL